MSKSATSGRDAVRKYGRGPDRPDNYSWNGSPTSPSKFSFVGGSKTVPGVGAGASRSWGRRPDEMDRSGLPSGGARVDKYTDRPRSDATGGNPSARSRAPRPYTDY
jgi:hypothetical protein